MSGLVPAPENDLFAHQRYIHMRLSAIAAAAVLSLSLAYVGTTRAETNNDLSGPEHGWYLGAGFGRFNLKPQDISNVGSGLVSITNSHNDAFKIPGGYRLMPFLGLEVNYIDFGTPNSTFYTTGSNGNYKVHASGFAPMGVATLPLGPFEIFGKAGWLFSNNNVKVYLNQT